jgi:hypothetical protein
MLSEAFPRDHREDPGIGGRSVPGFRFKRITVMPLLSFLSLLSLLLLIAP